MIFHRSCALQLLLIAGANLSTEGLAPAHEPAPSEWAIREDDRAGPANGPHLWWRVPANHRARAVVEVLEVDPADLRALARSEITADRWNSFFVVRLAQSKEGPVDEQPPLWGSYRVAGDILRFEPRFPLEPGMRYRAEFDPVRLHEVATELSSSGTPAEPQHRSTTKLTALYSSPKKALQPSAQVVEINPSRDLLPENLLHFYIYFSAPMSRGEAYQRITLLDKSTGKIVDRPFLELDEELWSPDGTRFTLVFDPGRIKRGLRPREEVGPILTAGKTYSLVVDRHWPDASGNFLKTGYSKTFRVGPPDESSPDPKTWLVGSPVIASCEPLVIRFPEPLDRGLLERLIWVEDAKGVLSGQVSLGAAETIWRFTPSSAWREGGYRVVVGTELEDVAGNSVAQPFEVDAVGPISPRVTAKTVDLPFRIGQGSH